MNKINGKMIVLSIVFFSLGALFFFPTFVRADWIDPRDERFQTPYRNMYPAFFPKCLPSRGNVVAYYPTGIHGIPGDFTTHFGADIVYSLDNDNYLQCYCPLQGAMGIQVNWLASSNLSVGEMADLLAQGWYYVPSGGDWGLAEQPYLTRSISQIMCVRPLAPR